MILCQRLLQISEILWIYLNMLWYALICFNMLGYAGGQLQCNQVEKASIGCVAGFLGFIGILRWIYPTATKYNLKFCAWSLCCPEHFRARWISSRCDAIYGTDSSARLWSHKTLNLILFEYLRWISLPAISSWSKYCWGIFGRAFLSDIRSLLVESNLGGQDSGRICSEAEMEWAQGEISSQAYQCAVGLNF